MVKFKLPIDVDLQIQLLELCALRGVTYISIVVSEGKIYFGATTPEYLKILVIATPTDCEALTIRVPVKILKPILSVSTLVFEVGEKLLITKHEFSKISAKIHIPVELDYVSEFVTQVVAKGQALPDVYTDLRVLGELREISAIEKIGVQVKDKLAYMDCNGFMVFKEVPGISNNLFMSNDCISMLIAFTGKTPSVQLFGHENFDIAKRGDMYFGWRRARSAIQSPYSDYLSLQPLFRKSMSLTSCRQIIKSIAVEKTKTYECNINFEKDYINIRAGNLGTFICNFSGQFIQEPEDEKVLQVSIPFALFKGIITVSTLDWESFIFEVFDSCVALKFGRTTILIVRK